MCTFENLYLAWLETRRGKSTKRQAVHFESQLEENLCAPFDELQSGTYQPGGYTTFYIHEKKRRKISVAPFRDRWYGPPEPRNRAVFRGVQTRGLS